MYLCRKKRDTIIKGDTTSTNLTHRLNQIVDLCIRSQSELNARTLNDLKTLSLSIARSNKLSTISTELALSYFLK